MLTFCQLAHHRAENIIGNTLAAVQISFSRSCKLGAHFLAHIMTFLYLLQMSDFSVGFI